MSAAPEEIAGWRGRTLAKDGDTTVIYTNIENAAAKTIGSLYRPPATQGNRRCTIVWFQSWMACSKIFFGLMPREPMKIRPPPAIGDVAVTTFAGSVQWIGGYVLLYREYNLHASDREHRWLSLADSGDGAWTFTPTDPNGTIDVPNPAYVSFGWWLNAMGTDVEDAYEFDAFASAAGMVIRDELLVRCKVMYGLTGSATYKGGAAGKWAMQSTT